MKKRFEKTKIYGIFQKMEDGSLLGYTEHSISMLWDKKLVRVWRELSHSKHNLSIILRDKNYTGKVFIARIGSKKCPVSLVNWNPCHPQKFHWRNSNFSLKKDLTTSNNFTD